VRHRGSNSGRQDTLQASLPPGRWPGSEKRIFPWPNGCSPRRARARWGRRGRARGGASRPSPSSEVKDGSRNQRERPRVEQRRCLGLGAAARVQSQTKAFEPKPMEDRAAGFWCSEIRERPHGEDPGGGANALVCSLTARIFFLVTTRSPALLRKRTLGLQGSLF
jgi:hypothetical protein